MADPIDRQIHVQQSDTESFRAAHIDWPGLHFGAFITMSVIFMPDINCAIVIRKPSFSSTPEWRNHTREQTALVQALKKIVTDNVREETLLSDQRTFTTAFIRALDDTRAMAAMIGAQIVSSATETGGKGKVHP